MIINGLLCGKLTTVFSSLLVCLLPKRCLQLCPIPVNLSRIAAKEFCFFKESYFSQDIIIYNLQIKTQRSRTLRSLELMGTGGGIECS